MMKGPWLTGPQAEKASLHLSYTKSWQSIHCDALYDWRKTRKQLGQAWRKGNAETKIFGISRQYREETTFSFQVVIKCNTAKGNARYADNVRDGVQWDMTGSVPGWTQPHRSCSSSSLCCIKPHVSMWEGGKVVQWSGTLVGGGDAGFEYRLRDWLFKPRFSVVFLSPTGHRTSA
jgi:hypothetical protein